MVPRPNVEEGSCTSKDGCLIVSWTGLDSPRPCWAALRANLCTRHEFHNINIHIDIHIYIGLVNIQGTTNKIKEVQIERQRSLNRVR